METIDIEKLRNDLIDYYGTSSFYNKIAMMDLIEIEKASDEQIINIAIQNNVDLSRYEIKSINKKSRY